MKLNKIIISLLGLALAMPVISGAVSPLIVSCVGVPSSGSITWTASSDGGVPPISYLWGNSVTTAVQTTTVAPGFYSITLQGTDASSTVATTICQATVTQSAPTIASFTANPSTITGGQSSLLSWTVSNASSTSINNNIGSIIGTSISVSPTVTTTYQLSAVNPIGITTANITVTVNPVSTGNNVQAQIQSLLNQISSLRTQLAQLLLQQQPGNTASSTPGIPSNAACFNFNRDLSRGHKGEDVKELQKFLAKDSTIFSTTSVTGFFGPLTEKALQKYQRKFGIFSVSSTTTGYFGPKTRKFYEEHCKIEKNNHEDEDDDSQDDD